MSLRRKIWNFFKPESNFKPDEFKCPCCSRSAIDAETLTVLEELRDVTGGPIWIISGYRCYAYNLELKGAAQLSWHMTGKAVDIWSPKWSAVKIYNYLAMKYPNKYGIALKEYTVHLDTRPIEWRKIYLAKQKEVANGSTRLSN